MTNSMTPRERWLAAVRLEPVDRLPFWPKIDGSYPRAQAGRFREMGVDDLHAWIGSDRHVGTPCCVREVRKTTSVAYSRTGNESRKVFTTPHGRKELVCQFDEASCSWHPVQFPVTTPEDIRLMAEIFEDVTVELDPTELEKVFATVKRLGQDAVTAVSVGESPLMFWIEWVANLDNGQYLLADCREEVERLFAAMQRVLVETTKLVCKHHPADLIYLTENTSTTLISPEQYRTYCSPQVGACADLVRAAGRNCVLHMCGHLKAILPELAGVRARAFEAFTSPTLGNTTLLDGRRGCPDVCLIGGTNAMLWLKPAREIIAEIQARLDELPHHRGIVLTSSGVMPPRCKPETIKDVCDWVKTYPVRM